MFRSEVTTDGPRVASPDHERRWETALRTPFRIVFLPLRLVANGLEVGIGHFGPRYLDPKPHRPEPLSPTLALSVVVGDGTTLGIGPAITWVGFPTMDSRLRATGSWSLPDHRHARFSEAIGTRHPVSVALRADYDYKPNRSYYGIGNASSEADLSYFRLETMSAEAALLLGRSRLRQVRIVGGYSNMTPLSAYNGSPPLEAVFATADVPYDDRATQEFLYGVTADFAALDDNRHPSRGVHARVDLKRASGVRSSDPNYNQWNLEGRAYVPVFAKRRVLAFRGIYAGIGPLGSATTTIPFYRLIRSDGVTNFAGYAPNRFRDRQLLLGRVEYRWMIVHEMSAIALFELGAVASRSDAFTLRDAHRSVGGGLRLGRSELAAVRLEIAKSDEGLRVALDLGSTF